MDQQNTQRGGQRPAVLDNITASQIDELDLQFNEGDHGEWNRITESYGWSKDDANAVWQWFGQRPKGAQGPPREGFPGEGER